MREESEPHDTSGGGGETETVRLVETTRYFGTTAAVDRVNLNIHRRELFTLLGPSGSGKTTILRMVAGLIRPTSGQIWLGAEQVQDRPPNERNIGMVFQSLALFPHLDVFANIAFPMRMRRAGRREIADRVRGALEMVRLPNIANRKTSELSGGQQQRVALARALVYEPELLLLDEPLGALDRRLREEMQLEIVRLHQEIDVTIVNVTHDQREALMLSDRIGVMRMGRLEQWGPSEDLYRHPRSRFVAEFLGDANLLVGSASTDGLQAWVTTPSGSKIRVEDLSDDLVGRECAVVVRAESIWVADPAESLAADGNRFRGQVVVKAFEGPSVYYEIAVRELNAKLKILVPESARRQEFQAGEAVLVGWDPPSATLLGPEEQGEQPSGYPPDASD